MPWDRFEEGDRVIVDESWPLNIMDGDAPSDMMQYFGVEGTVKTKERFSWFSEYDNTLITVLLDDGRTVGRVYSRRFKLVERREPNWEV